MMARWAGNGLLADVFLSVSLPVGLFSHAFPAAQNFAEARDVGHVQDHDGMPSFSGTKSIG